MAEWQSRCGIIDTMLRRLSFLATLGLAWVAGCAATTPVLAGAPAAPTLDDVVAAARADAARRSGRQAAVLQLLSAERVTWSDGSLGCPRPGLVYTMALVPGYRVRLVAGTEVFDYHTDLRGTLSLCPDGMAADPPGPQRY